LEPREIVPLQLPDPSCSIPHERAARRGHQVPLLGFCGDHRTEHYAVAGARHVGTNQEFRGALLLCVGLRLGGGCRWRVGPLTRGSIGGAERAYSTDLPGQFLHVLLIAETGRQIGLRIGIEGLSRGGCQQGDLVFPPRGSMGTGAVSRAADLESRPPSTSTTARAGRVATVATS